MAYSTTGDGSINGGTRLTAGLTANGTLTITSGAYFVTDISAGSPIPATTTTGTVTLTGASTTVDVNPGVGYVPIVQVGVENDGGNGYLEILSGAVVTTTRTVDANANGNDNNLSIGAGFNSTGQVTIDGAGSQFTAGGTAGRIYVGANSGNGTLTVSNSGLAETLDLAVGTNGIGEVRINSGGTIRASDAISAPEASDPFGPFVSIGQGTGTGTLIIESGGQLNVDNAGGANGLGLTFGVGYGSTGFGTIDGAGSALNLTNTNVGLEGPILRIGGDGHGDVTVSNDAQINLLGGNVSMSVGEGDYYGGPPPLQSQLQILSGADVLIDSQGYGGYDAGTNRPLGSRLFIGVAPDGSGRVLVDGAGSTLSVTSQSELANDYGTGRITIGQNGFGELDVSNGGAVTARQIQAGTNAGTGRVDVESGGTVTVIGTNETAYQGIRVGDNNGSQGFVTIDGAGSTVTSRGSPNPTGSADGFPDDVIESSGRFRIGGSGYGKVDITNGGTGNGFFVELGRNNGGTAYLNVDGFGSSFNASNEFGTFEPNSYGLTGGFVRLGRYGGSYGKAEITNGGVFNAINQVGTVADEPGIDLGRKVNAKGVLIVDGDDGSGNASTLNIQQTGRGNDGANPGTVTGPFLQLGRDGGEGVVTIRNGGEAKVSGESATVTIGRGQDYGTYRTADQSVLTVESGGRLTVDGRGAGYEERGEIIIGTNQGGNGRLVVTGTGSTVLVYSDNADDVSATGGVEFGAMFNVGATGRGELLVENGGQITVDGADDAYPSFGVGGSINGQGEPTLGYATITGAGSRVDIIGTSLGASPTAVVGAGGTIDVGLADKDVGILTIADGGVLNNSAINSDTEIAQAAGSRGEVTVTGAGSTLNAGTRLAVSANIDLVTGSPELTGKGDGHLTIEAGGLVTAVDAYVGDMGTLNLSSTLQANTEVTGTLNVGGDTATGTGDITGDFTQNSGILDFEIVDATNLDLLRITGDATIAAGAFMVDLSGLGPVSVGDRFDILEVDGQLTLDVTQIDLSGTGAPAGVTVSVERNGTPDGLGGSTDNVVTVVVDAAPANAVSIIGLDQSVVEGDPGDDRFFIVNLERSGDISQELTVDFSITGTGANPVDGADFEGGVLPSGQVTFLAGEATFSGQINIEEDEANEGDETFTLSISNPVTAGTVPTVSNGSLVGTIINDDQTGPGTLTLLGLASQNGSNLTVSNGYDGSAVFDGGRHTFNSLNVSLNTAASNNPSVTGSALLQGAAAVFVQPFDQGQAAAIRIGIGRDAGYASDGTLSITEGSVFEARNNTTNDQNGNVQGGYYNVNVGRGVDGTGLVEVMGEGSTLLATGGAARINIGRDGGTGTLRVEDGGYVGTFNLTAGRGDVLTTGSVLVDGPGSTIRLSPEFGFYGPAYAAASGYNTIGRGSAGKGYLTIQNGGSVIVDNGDKDTAFLRLARDLGGYGYAKVTGTGSSLKLDQVGPDSTNTGALLLVGDGGQGRMIVEDSATVDVKGEGARISIADGRSNTGAFDQSLLAVRSGAVVTVDPGGYRGGKFDIGGTPASVGGSVDVGAGNGTNGRLEISGAGSRLIVQNDLDDTTEAQEFQFAPFVTIGGSGSGELLVENGGRLVIDGADDTQPGFSVGQGSSAAVTSGAGSATVTGTGSVIDVIGTGSGDRNTPVFNDAGFIAVGRNDGTTGSLLIEQGGRVNNPTADSVTMIGPRPGGTGTVTVKDAGSVLNAGALLAVGGDFDASTGITDLLNGGSGTLNIADGGAVNAGTALFGTNGTLNIDDGTLNVGDLEINGGSLNAGGPNNIGLATIIGDVDLSLGLMNFEIQNVTTFGADRVVIDGDASIEEASFNFDFSGLGAVAVGNSVTILEVTGQLTNLDVNLIDLSAFSPPTGVTFDLVQSSNPDGTNNLISLEVTAAGSGNVSVVGFEQFVDEGNPGDDQRFVYTLERTGDLSNTLDVDFVVAGRGANPVDGVDFDGGTLPTGTATFLATEATTTIELLISEDTTVEADEGLLLTISNPVDGGGGTINVVNADAPGTIRNDDNPDSISINPFSSVLETDPGSTSLVTFTVTRTGDLIGDLTVDYVVDASGDSSNTDLLANATDFTAGIPQNGQVTILDGDATATFTVEIEGDDDIEPREDFDVTLTNFSGDPTAFVFGVQTAQGQIINDDGRPPVIPVGLEADVFGDPHLVTLDGLGYDFQAVGEFTLVENTAGADLNVQIRTAPVPGSDLVSIISAMATDMGNGDTIMIDAFGSPALLVNGVPTEVPNTNADPITVGTGEIFFDGETYTIVFGSGEALTVKQFDGFLNVCVFLDPVRGPGEVHGLLGNADGDLTNDYRLRDGTPPGVDDITFDGAGTPSLDFDYLYTTYADSWRITDATSLFDYTGAPGDQGTGDYTDTNFPVGVLSVDILPADLLAEAEAAADAAGIVDPVLREAAILDFALTGDDQFAEGASGVAADPDVNTQPNDAPVLPTTVGVTATDSQVTEGNAGAKTVNFTFYRIGDLTDALQVSYTVGGTADMSDLSGNPPLSGDITFGSGQSTVSLSFDIAGDFTAEADETLVVNLIAPSDVLVGAPQAVTTIVNDDNAPVTQDDAGTTDEDTTLDALVSDLLLNDVDPDGDAITLIGFDSVSAGGAAVTELGGTITYDPTQAFNSLDTGQSDLDTFTYTVSDGNGGTDTATVTVTVTGVTDESIVDDVSTVAENATVDIDVEANDNALPGRVLGTVAGQAVVVGDVVTLGSGAEVTVNADGTLGYDPNGRFNSLVSAATAATTGATNTSALDTFTYSLGGLNDVATVSVTITGVDGVGDQLAGDEGNNSLTGSNSFDLFFLDDGGFDEADGGDGNDGFFFGDQYDRNDKVNGGDGIGDQIGLQGDYSEGVVFGSEGTVDVETIALLPGDDTRFGASGDESFSYDITLIDDNIEAGEELNIVSNTLREGEDVKIDASAEQDGNIFTFGGMGAEDIKGTQQRDAFFFGTSRFAAGDRVDGQGERDSIGLQGDFPGGITFGEDQLISIEILALLSSQDARFGSNAFDPFSYDLTMANGNVAAGETMFIIGNTLLSTESLTVDGSAETDGMLNIFSGNGDDLIKGSQNSDSISGFGGVDDLTGNNGDDIFIYSFTTDSAPGAEDTIRDFTLGDTIDLAAVDADTNAANDQAFTFIGDAAFNNVAGELRAVNSSGSNWVVEADTNGDGLADMAINVITTDADPITNSDFVL